MADKTAIQWTNATWNPVTGCTKVSPGCANCYIERTPPFRMAGRRFVKGKIPVQLHPERLDKPLHWRQPRRVFVCSMADLFHEDVPDEFIDRVFATMALCGATRMTCKWANCDHDEDRQLTGCWMQGDGREHPRHTFQVLTKRPERMREYLSAPGRRERIEEVGNDPEWSIQWEEPADIIASAGWPLPNVWLGVSAENQKAADQRIPILLDTPAAKRFVSCEPLLGPLDLKPRPRTDLCIRCGEGPDAPHDHPDGYRNKGLDWVIVGGESGPKGRWLVEKCKAGGPHGHPDLGQGMACPGWRPKVEAIHWLRSIRDQCVAADVAVFLKQLGGPTPGAGGRTLDGRTWDEFPQRVAVPA